MDQDELMKEILESAETIASVGLSGNEEKASHWIGVYLMGERYRVIPVNPTTDKILGEKSILILSLFRKKSMSCRYFAVPKTYHLLSRAPLRLARKLSGCRKGL